MVAMPSLMQSLLPEYAAIDKSKGARGKLLNLKQFWKKAKKMMFEKHTWQELNTYGFVSEKEVICAVNKVSDSHEDEDARHLPPI